MIKQNYEVEILVNGKPVKEYSHNYKRYIEGREGTIFSLRLRNNTAERALFVPTIDGLSVIDGKEGSIESSRGYVVNKYSATIVDGWRISDDEVAEFYFSSPNDAYRKLRKKGNNIGSIGIAVFQEKPKREIQHTYFGFPQIYYRPYHRGVFFDDIFPTYSISTLSITSNTPDSLNVSSTSNASDIAFANTVSQEVGTGFGETKSSKVTSTEFDRPDMPTIVLEILYNTRKQLEKLGIDFSARDTVISEPNSFPASSEYCQKPSK